MASRVGNSADGLFVLPAESPAARRRVLGWDAYLLCVLPGYIFQLAIRGADAVKPIPDAIRGLFLTDGTAHT